MINDEIYALLSGSAALTAIVGARIYPVTPPQDFQYAGPFLVYSRVSNKSVESHAGSSGLATARYQFSGYSKKSNKEARQIVEQVRLLLQNYRGGSIQNCSHQNDFDIYEAETLLHHVPTDFMITYAEPQPA